MNPAIGKAMMTKAGKTVRFKASKVLRASV
jgi:nucleoid DNA-binding protein